MARKTVKPPANVPAPLPLPVPPPPPEEPNDDPPNAADAMARLRAMAGTAGAGTYAVYVYRKSPEGRLRQLVKRPLDGFDTFDIGDEFGAGAYAIQLRNERNEIAGQTSFEHDGPARPSPTPAPLQLAPAPPASPAAAPAEPAKPAMDLTQLLLAMMQQQTTIITAMIGRGNGLDLKDLIPLLRQEKASPLADVVAGMEAIERLAAGRGVAGEGEGSGGGDPFTAALGAFLPKLIEAGAANQQPHPGAPPAPFPPMRMIPAPPGFVPRPGMPTVAARTAPTAPTMPTAPAPAVAQEPPATPAVAGDAPPAPPALSILAMAFGELARVIELGAAAKEPEPAAYATTVADAIEGNGIEVGPLLTDDARADTFAVLAAVPRLNPIATFVHAVVAELHAMYDAGEPATAPAEAKTDPVPNAA